MNTKVTVWVIVKGGTIRLTVMNHDLLAVGGVQVLTLGGPGREHSCCELLGDPDHAEGTYKVGRGQVNRALH